MEGLEQENKDLLEGMASMQADIEKLTAMMTSALPNQNQTSDPQPTDTPLAQSIPTAIHVSVALAGTSQPIIPEGFPGSMANMFNEGLCPAGSIEFSFTSQYIMPKGFP